MLVTDQDIEEAITFLSDTDSNFAQIKTQMEGLATKRDLIEKEVFLHSDGNVEERKAQARTHENTKQAHRDYLDAMRKFEELKNKRDTCHVSIWIWRSLKASERSTV